MSARAVPTARADLPAWVAPLALGCLAVAWKPVTAGAAPTLLMVGAIGLLLPGATARARRGAWLGAVAVGIGAFAVARVMARAPGIPATVTGVWLTSLAAVAEEALFRRALYGWLARWGALPAVVVSSVVFALVHAPLYGNAVIPIDLTAGLLFGWQRWATGSWTAPAATHVAANLVMLGW